MKLTTIILIATLVQVSAASFGQRVTLHEKNVTLEKMFNEIRKQTGYDVLLYTDELKSNTKIDANFKNTPLEEVLKNLCQQQDLSYQVKERSIIFSRSRQSRSLLERFSDYIAAVEIHGRVTDSTGVALVGASVKINGQSKSISTDQNGEFDLSAQVDDQVTISFVGYQNYSFTIRAEMRRLNIVLHAVSSSLNEVVVNTGYQKLSKERITGSFEKIDSALINRTVSTDILSRLNNNFSSLYKDVITGRIQVRGIKSLNSTDLGALIVVDNFEYSGDLNNINPNDVESISVLKDAAAASIWGSRAGNGVVVITTKKGKFNQRASISFNSNLTLTQKPQLMKTNQISTSDYIDVEKYLFAQGRYNDALANTFTYPLVSPVVELLNKTSLGQITQQQADTQIDLLRGKDVRKDYLSYLYRTSAKQQYSLGVSGGGEKVGYRIAAGYDHNLDNAIGNGYNRVTVTSAVDMRPLKNLDISTTINLAQSKQTNNSPGSPLQLGGDIGEVMMYPYSSLKDASGGNAYFTNYRSSFIDTAGNGRLLDWRYNPLNELQFADNTTTSKYASINVNASYQIIPGLRVSLNGQHDDQSLNGRNYHSTQTYLTRDLINRFTQLGTNSILYPIPNSGILDYSNTGVVANSLRGQANYEVLFGGKHLLSFLAGSELRSAVTKVQGDRVYGYDDNVQTVRNVDLVNAYQTYDNIYGFSQIYAYGGTRFSKRTSNTFSMLASGSYTYDQKYVVTASVRKDESNLFGVSTNKKGLPLYSAGAMWNVSKEDFFKVPVFDYVKIKANFGTRGIINNSVSALVTLEANSNARVSNLPYNTIQNSPNPQLRYEKVTTSNVGTEFSLLKGLLTAEVSYYWEKSTDLIAPTPYDATSGYTLLVKNSANLTNKGLDLTLNVHPLKGPLQWNASLLFSHNKTVVTKYLLNDLTISPAQYVIASGLSPVVGLSPYNFITYKWAGLNPATGAPRGYLNGQVSENYSDIQSKGTWEDLTVAGSRVPTTRGTFRNTFSYKNISVSLSIGYSFNYYFQRNVLSYTDLFNGGLSDGSGDYTSRWQKPGDELKTNVPSMIFPGDDLRNYFYQMSSINLEKADNIRLNDVTFSYKINPQALKKIFRDGVTIYGSAYNLGVIWKATKFNVDPDSQVMPMSKSYTIGVKVDL